MGGLLTLGLVLGAVAGCVIVGAGLRARYASLFAEDWRVTSACEGVSALGGIIVAAAIIGAVQ